MFALGDSVAFCICSISELRQHFPTEICLAFSREEAKIMSPWQHVFHGDLVDCGSLFRKLDDADILCC